VHGWLERARPCVLVLTDGSGRAGSSRLDSTRRVLADAGAVPGPIFGRSADRAMYASMLDRDPAPFRALARELVGCLDEVDYVVGDAAEGYNPTHDVCRMLIDAAVAAVRRRTGRRIPSFAFPLIGPPHGATRGRSGDVELVLDDAAFARKLDAARGYGELAPEVAATLAEVDAPAFRVEAFAQAEATGATPSCGPPPFYERHGEARVAAGVYARVLRQREHVLPIAEALACGF
jgi:hypothetical protein